MYEFYDVKSREKVSLEAKDVAKVTYESTTKSGKTQVRYAFRGSYQGRKLTKFVNQATWESAAVASE